LTTFYLKSLTTPPHHQGQQLYKPTLKLRLEIQITDRQSDAHVHECIKTTNKAVTALSSSQQAGSINKRAPKALDRSPEK